MSELVLEKNNLPKHWCVTSLGNVVTPIKGKKPKTLGEKNNDLTIPYITIQTFEKNIFENFTDDVNCPRCNDHDVLIVWDGARSGLVGTGVNGVIGSTIAKLFCYDINPKYLYYFLQKHYDTINKNPKGIGIPHVNPTVLWNLEFPIPPLNEQKRIVAKIEELFSLIEKIEEILTKSINQITNLSQKIIDEYTMITDFKCGTEYRLGDIADIKGGVTLGRKIKGKTIKIPYLRVANVQDGYLDLEQIKEIEILEKEKDKWILDYGDILLTEGGDRDKLGRGTIWQKQIQNCIHQNHIFRVRLDSSRFIPEYISMILRSSSSKQFFQSKGKQSVNLASINKTQLSSIEFFCPNIDLQKQRLATIQQSLDQLQFFTIIGKRLRQIIFGLRNSILTQAFEGKLIPQDPNDESAEMLLQKIKQEKQKIISQTKRGKKNDK